MNAHALLDELRALDVRLTAEGDLLGVNAPAGSLTEQMKEDPSPGTLRVGVARA